jgi:hypothetical protein
VAAHGRRLLVHVRPERLGLGRAPERRRSRQTLVQYATQRVAVSATVDRITADLLRRQVVERADRPARVRRCAAQLLCDPEVRQIGVAALVQQHVRRLDVAMDQRAPVRGVERAGHLGQHRERPLRGEFAVSFEHALQVASLDEVHRHVQLPVVLAGLVDRDHVGVVKRRGEPRLAQQARPEPLVLGQLRRNQL